jgi:uncharacterized protein
VRFICAFLAKMFEFWHKTISTVLPHACRYEPSCSLYAAEALRTHGLARGLWMALGRLARCHPWGRFGYDPVPRNVPPIKANKGHA